MNVHLHAEYRQFARVRQSGEIITVRDGIGTGLIARGEACPVIDGVYQCQLADPPEVSGEYLDEQMNAPANEMMLPVKWSRQKRLKLQATAHRSRKIREAIKGKRWEQVPRGIW